MYASGLGVITITRKWSQLLACGYSPTRVKMLLAQLANEDNYTR